MKKKDEPYAPYTKRNTHMCAYGIQCGMCPGCHRYYHPKDMVIDHIVPRVAGGSSDLYTNIQLLCAHCNSVKGTGTMDELHTKLEGMEQMWDALYKNSMADAAWNQHIEMMERDGGYVAPPDPSTLRSEQPEYGDI